MCVCVCVCVITVDVQYMIFPCVEGQTRANGDACLLSQENLRR